MTESPYIGEYSGSKPMIIGSTKNEARMFTKFDKTMCTDQSDRFLPFTDKSEKTRILSNYDNYPSFEANSSLLTDLMYTIPKHWMADNYVKSNKVYLYRFDFYAGFFKINSLKACHASDVPLLFNVGTKFYFGKILKEKSLGKMIRTYWGNFAKNGDPNGDKLVNWDNYTSSNEKMLVLNYKPALTEHKDDHVKNIYNNFNSFFHK